MNAPVIIADGKNRTVIARVRPKNTVDNPTVTSDGRLDYCVTIRPDKIGLDRQQSEWCFRRAANIT